jgi:hypothetical protein
MGANVTADCGEWDFFTDYGHRFIRFTLSNQANITSGIHVRWAGLGTWRRNQSLVPLRRGYDINTTMRAILSTCVTTDTPLLRPGKLVTSNSARNDEFLFRVLGGNRLSKQMF